MGLPDLNAALAPLVVQLGQAETDTAAAPYTATAVARKAVLWRQVIAFMDEYFGVVRSG
jgi:hypothetical protein